MAQNQPLVSISLLTYNAQPYLKSCLNSVFNQTYPHLELLIIDNASTDGTIDYLKKISLRQTQLKTKIIFNKKNVGFAAGHNQGIRESKGDFILCLNQDVVLDSDFIKEAVKVLQKDKKIGAVQGKLWRWNIGSVERRVKKPNAVSYVIDTTGLCMLKNRRIINRHQGEIDQGQFEKEEEIFGADGATPVYRRKALEEVGISLNQTEKKEYFDEDFFAYKEDVDLAWRLRLYGWRTIYQPKAKGWHARTAGDSAAVKYWAIIKERLKINKFAKYLAFKNQRLMQLKNEQLFLFLKHLPFFLPKEIASWLFVLIFERYTWRAIKDLFKQAPKAWQKRKIIMARKKVDTTEMERWFC